MRPRQSLSKGVVVVKVGVVVVVVVATATRTTITTTTANNQFMEWRLVHKLWADSVYTRADFH